MLFNSFEFVFLFLPIVVFFYYASGKYVNNRASVLWLITSSLFFYGWWNPVYLSLLILSIAVNFLMSVYIKNAEERSRKPLLVVGISLNLAMLAYFKYANFFVDIINVSLNTSFNIEHILLPLAISFFTFQQIAYLVDVYRNEVKELNLSRYILFVCFFPQLIAGPIVHHKEMMPQFVDNKRLKEWQKNITYGLFFFSVGLFKKIILADSAGAISTPLFAEAASGVQLSLFESWAAALGYTFQLYFDFSGYCDMAIGAARMFGIKLPINFNAPYKAVNIIEFWRRWHMTLSRFLRDYLYIPLGGGRKGEARKKINLMITMVLGGMWHGAGWTFIIWGGMHGIFLIINHTWRSIRRDVLKQDLSKSTFVGRFLSITITFFLVIVAWVFFRADTTITAISIIEGMMGLNGVTLPGVFANISPFITAALSTLGITATAGGGQIFYEQWSVLLFIVPFIFGPTSHQIINYLKNNNRNLGSSKRVAYAFSFVLLISVININQYSEFLYFQF